MKKLLTLMIAAVLLLGCVNVTAYADEKITTIKATVAAVQYEIVVPESVDMSAPGIIKVARPSVEDVKGASANTVISYTAEGTDFKLSGGTDTMDASYYSDLAGKTPFLPTTEIVVYENNAVVSTLPEIYVGVKEEDWYNATPGEYQATVTFNFECKNNIKPATMKVGEILGTFKPGFPTDFVNGWKTKDVPNFSMYLDGNNLKIGMMTAGGEIIPRLSVSIDEQATSNANGYEYTSSDNKVLRFFMTDNVLTSIEFNEGGGPLMFQPNN